MTRLEKCELLKSKGYTYNPETGQIFGIRGKEIGYKNHDGYIALSSNYFNSQLLAHHFAWYMCGRDMDFIELDHENRIRHDNCIDNLRISNRSQQTQNTNAKGCYWRPKLQKWQSQIQVNKKQIHLGLFNTEVEAKEAYINAKKKYHNI